MNYNTSCSLSVFWKSTKNVFFERIRRACNTWIRECDTLLVHEHAQASHLPVTQPVVWLCIRLSGGITGQLLGIRMHDLFLTCPHITFIIQHHISRILTRPLISYSMTLPLTCPVMTSYLSHITSHMFSHGISHHFKCRSCDNM